MSPYEELGLTFSATSEEIKQRYKSLAQIHHPDRGGDEEKFKRIKLAYEILIDPKLRHEYDTTGKINNDRTPRSCAIEDICHLARCLIPTINPEHDDLIFMMKARVNGFRANISQNIKTHNSYIINSQKIVDRIKRKDDGENMIRHIAEIQLQQLKNELNVFNKQLEVNDEMLLILEDYRYDKEDLSPILNITPPTS